MNPDKLRIFIAAPLPDALVTQLHALAHNYESEQIRIVPRENLHLTLLFIGNTNAERLPDLTGKLHRIALEQAAFTLQPEGIYPGPGKQNPRLVWARFAKNPEFEALSVRLQQQLAPEVNLPKEMIPHITLARMRKDKPIAGELPTFPANETQALQVSEMGLWKSVLGTPHPTYSVLQSFPFAKV